MCNASCGSAGEHPPRGGLSPEILFGYSFIRSAGNSAGANFSSSMNPRLLSTPEPLEARISPATLVSSSVVTYQDIDGDTVTIKASAGIFDAATVETLLRFSSGGVDGSNATPQQLQLINLGAVPGDAAEGISLTISAKRSADTGGDARVNVGAITGAVDLGTIKINGDLGRIVAGNSDQTTASLKALAVHSMGVLGTSTQGAGGTLTSLLSGPVGSITLKSHFEEATLRVQGQVVDGVNSGSLAKLTIGGSVFGGRMADSGEIAVDGAIGKVVVKGSLLGGSGTESGRIASAERISSVVISGSILGGLEDGTSNFGEGSGAVVAGLSIGSIKVGRDLRGGDGAGSGLIDGGALIESVTIGGSMIGGDGEESGSIIAESFDGEIRSVKVRRDVQGGDGDESAYIHAGAVLGSVAIGGSLRGGDGELSALIYAGSAIVAPHLMQKITIGGDMVGGNGTNSGSIGAAFAAAGGLVDLQIGTITIKGSVVGVGLQSASITGNSIASLTIGGDLSGGLDSSGNVLATGMLTKMSVGGSVTGSFEGSAQISAGGIGSLKIGGDLRGGAGSRSARIDAGVEGIQSITISGSIIGGQGGDAGSITSEEVIDTLTIGGSVVGTAESPVGIRARGVDGTAALAIGKLTIKGSVSFLEIVGGSTSSAGKFDNGDANLGVIVVGGDWIAGTINAGVLSTDGKFGNADDAPAPQGNTAGVFSRIASITIKGQAQGSADSTEGFGFVAEEIGKLKIGSVTYPFTSAPLEVFALGATGNFFAREVG
jgi:hypothetical protein